MKFNASSRIMYEEAQKMGIECVGFEDNETILMSYKNAQWYVRGSRTSLQSSVGKTIADQKSLTKKVLSHFKLPTANFAVLHDGSEISNIYNLQFPLVIKPLFGKHGKGVITAIKDLPKLEEQLALSNFPMLVEEQLVGIEYRVVCVNFKFVATAFRKPAHVVGNGQNTIQELISQKNAHPWRGKGHEANLTLIEVDEQVLKNLNDQSLNLSSIPSLNQEVFLRKTANLSTGGEAWDVTDKVHPLNKELFEKIARACDLNVIGIDIMCQDISTPIIAQKKAGIIEVNASPGLRMHHYPVKGNGINVAKKILDMVISQKI